MIIARHGEIYTKSRPVRRQFINKLAGNVKKALPDAKVIAKRWRLLIYPEDEAKAIKELAKIPGIVSFSKCIETKCDMSNIKRAIQKLLPRLKNKTFAIRTHRLTKDLMESQRINEIIGDFVRKKAKARVDLDRPEVTVGIELYNKKAYIFIDNYPGVGGLPLGTGGEMLLLKSKNSELAAQMLRKRGIDVVSRSNKPLGVVTGETNLNKIIKLKKKYKVPVYSPLIGLEKI